MASKKSKKFPHKWPDGTYHSIPAATHRQNVQAKQYGINLDDPVPTPLTNRGAFGMAEAAANRVYGPQISAAENVQTSLPSWFRNYTNQVGTSAQAAAQYAQPLIGAAQATANNTAQVAPGLDPSSPQYAKEQQAAQGRQAIAQLGASTLGGVATANQGYFNQLQATAARDQPLAQAYYGREVGRLKGERGQATVDEYGRIRTGEQNAQIAYGTLDVNRAEAADMNPITGKPNPPKPEDPYSSGAFQGYTPSQVRSKSKYWKDTKKAEHAARSGPGKGDDQPYSSGAFATYTPRQIREMPQADRQRLLDKFNKDEPSGKDTKKKEKITKATGGARRTVADIVTDWRSYVGQQTDDTSKPKDPKTGQYPGRALTPSEIKKVLGKKNKAYTPGMIHVALMVGGGKPLDQEAIDYLHALDPNLRIPREWIKGKKQTSTRPGIGHQ